MAIPATLQHPFPYAPGLPSPPPPPGNKPAPAWASAALAPPPAKKMATNPYVAFCREQRPLLPAHLRNAEREQTLGMRVGHVDTVLTRRAIGEPEEQAVQPRRPSLLFHVALLRVILRVALAIACPSWREACIACAGGRGAVGSEGSSPLSSGAAELDRHRQGGRGERT